MSRICLFTTNIFIYSQGRMNTLLSHPAIVKSVHYLTTPHFRFLQGLGLCCYGLKEIIFDSHRAPNTPLCERIRCAFRNCFNRIQSAPDFFIQHGAFFIGSGLAGALYALQQIQEVPINSFQGILQGCDYGFFCAAALLGLRYNVLNFIYTSDPREKKSAILGMISNLNYLFWCLCPLLGLSATLTVIFCGIALSTGCLKIIYDFFTI